MSSHFPNENRRKSWLVFLALNILAPAASLRTAMARPPGEPGSEQRDDRKDERREIKDDRREIKHDRKEIKDERKDDRREERKDDRREERKSEHDDHRRTQVRPPETVRPGVAPMSPPPRWDPATRPAAAGPARSMTPGMGNTTGGRILVTPAVRGSAPMQPTMVARFAPPPPRFERPVVHPGRVWIPGFHEWRDQRYVWVEGHEEPERPGFIWSPGRWELQEGNYVFIPGQWTSLDAYPEAPPPPPVAEPVAVRPGFVWIPGYQQWRDGRYVWAGGYWEAERRDERFHPGHWQRHGNRWVWHGGAWHHQ